LSHHPAASHQNNFGLLRLAFATLVIVSHSFELIDGNRTREPLTRVFGTLSVAEVAVAGFFIVSGYLVAQSYDSSASTLSYLSKRVLRIYPAFIAASLLCIFIVGPLAGADLAALSIADWARLLYRMLALQIPRLPDIFAGQAYPSLNGSMWTIAYEFRCYLVVAILGSAGLIKRSVVLPLTVVLWIGAVATTSDWPLMRFEGPFGNFHETLRLTAFFLTGTSFYLFRNRAIYRSELAAIAAVGLAIALFSLTLAGPAVAILGGYLVFWIAFLPGTPRLNEINSKTDVSYGIYLYAWPIQMLLIRYVAGISPPGVMLLTTISAGLLACLSWKFIEKPALSLKATFQAGYRPPRSFAFPEDQLISPSD
jgi:peptidoglycan/LPS O-acetylase OafA/YrhL